MRHFLRFLAGSLLFVFLVGGMSYASQLNNSIEKNIIIHSDTIGIDINNYIELFASELSVNSQSERCSEMFDFLYNYIEASPDISPDLLARINRYLGGYAYLRGNFENAREYYTRSLNAYQISDNPDTAGLCTVTSQLGLSTYNIGSYYEAVDYLEQSIRLRRVFYGDNSYHLIRPYANLSAVYIDMGEYESSRESSIKAIERVNNSGREKEILGLVYYNLGVYYSVRGDYNSAGSMYQMAETRQIEYDTDDLSMLLNIINGLSVSYNMTGDTLNAIKSYTKLIDVLESMQGQTDNGAIYYKNYGHFLARIGRYDESLDIFNKAVRYCYNNYGEDSERYLIAKEDLAYFYNIYMEDTDSAFSIYSDLFKRISTNNYGISIINDIKRGYANLWFKRGELDKALILYDEVLESGEYFDSMTLLFTYSFRSSIYTEKYIMDKSPEDLNNALKDIEAAVSILDSIKIDFSGEESRLQITGRFDFLWDEAIWLAYELYKNNKDARYLNMAFRYSEKSKASTLLSSTREVQAMEFHVPENLVKLEKELDHFIKELNDKLYVQTNSGNTDESLIDFYEEKRTDAVIARDSLIKLFENNYPRYYNLKHEDKVAFCEDVEKYIGRNKNFVEYFLSDSILYTFIINRRGCELISSSIDSTIRDIVLDFRSDIVNPAIETGARSQFNKIVKNGYYLYNLLIEPIKPYMVSNRLVIAADDILSYVPFEALISDTVGIKPINYRDIDFIFKEFEVIYAYSASLLIETEGKGRSLFNPALVFAPSYTSEIDSDSLLLSRQMKRGPLNNIPGAKEEAIFISNLLGGKLYLDKQASEQKFVYEASGEKIIHLAMHTLLNDREPMLSKMVFSQNSDTIENGLLNTYEIYDLDLDAKMVVLSSCNTGAGFLQSGEGVISLARGFMYAGSPAVVMSLWEVDDYSASEILKSFYLTLKHGHSKSEALKRAREKYLKSADQLRSHPYFWCALVIIGDDEPIFYNRLTIGLVLLLLISLIYVRKKYYRPKPS